MDPSAWLSSLHKSQYVTKTPTWERCLLQSSLVHLDDEDQETHWLQNPWCKDIATSTKKMN